VGVISTQVLQEFYVTVTRKLRVDSLIAKEVLHSLEHFEVVTISTGIIKEAIDCAVLNKISFWDSLIITAAEASKCTRVWSEDLNHGQITRGVKIHNPLLLQGES
jgi:predicted nucleic acid-binding protein